MSLIRQTGLGLALVVSLGVGSPAPSAVPETLNSRVAYCEMRRICNSYCVERVYGQHGVYCVRWSYTCRNVCEPGPYYPHYRPWRHGYWW